MKSKQLFNNYLLSNLNTLVALLFPIITFPYISRVLGSNYIGLINFAQSYGYYFIHIANFGISSYAVREISKVRNNKVLLEKKTNEIFNLNFFFSLISWIIYIIIVLSVEQLRDNLLLMLIYSIIVVTNYLTIDWLLQSFDDYYFSTKRNTIVRIISLILVFAFVKNQDDYIIYMLISTFSEMGARVSTSRYCRKKYSNLKYHLSYLNFRDHFKSLLTLFSFRLVNGISAQLDKLMLGFMLVYSDVGIYSVGVKVVLLLIPIIENIGVVLFPTLNVAANTSNEEYFKGLKINYKLILLLAIPMVVGLFLVSPMVIKLLAGDDYHRSVIVARIMSIVILLCPVGDLLGSKILLIFNKNEQLLISSCIVAISNIFFNFILIPLYGVNGATVASVISYIIAIMCRYYFVNKIMNFHLFNKDVIKIFAYTTPFIISYLIFEDLINTNIYAFVYYILSCTIIYILQLIIFKDEFVILMLNKIRRGKHEI